MQAQQQMFFANLTHMMSTSHPGQFSDHQMQKAHYFACTFGPQPSVPSAVARAQANVALEHGDPAQMNLIINALDKLCYTATDETSHASWRTATLW